MRRLRRWLLPLVLLAGAGAAGGLAVAIEADAATTADRRGGARLVTPVISARRVPAVIAAPVAERRLHDDLATWLETQPADTCLTVTHEDADIGFDHRSDAPLVPASTAKLLTGFATLERLGPDTRFRTAAMTTVPTTGEVLPGDLVLVGGGDPLLATADYLARFRRQPQVHTDLDQLAAAIAATGIRRVDGSVVGDESRYDAQRYVPEWPDRYVEEDQIGPLSALSVNDGFAAYPTSPDGPQDLEPAADPAAQAAAVLTGLLEARGVDVVGEPRRGVVPPGATEVAAIESVPVREVVAQMLRESDNSTAELLLKELGRTAADASTAGGRSVVLAALTSAGVDVSGVQVADGSGLGLGNRVPCDVLVDLLTGKAPADSVASGLAVAGRTGTLADRFLESGLEGILRAKTGTLNTVTSLAGTVTDEDGAIAFAVIVNTSPGQVVTPQLIASQEELGAALAAWPRVPDLDVLGPRDPVDR